jgi:hypothetical protein
METEGKVRGRIGVGSWNFLPHKTYEINILALSKGFIEMLYSTFNNIAVSRPDWQFHARVYQ